MGGVGSEREESWVVMGREVEDNWGIIIIRVEGREDDKNGGVVGDRCRGVQLDIAWISLYTSLFYV